LSLKKNKSGDDEFEIFSQWLGAGPSDPSGYASGEKLLQFAAGATEKNDIMFSNSNSTNTSVEGPLKSSYGVWRAQPGIATYFR